MIKTGLIDLDTSLSIKDDDLIVIGGVPNISKTTFISNIVANTTESVLVFSLEENKENFMNRILKIRKSNIKSENEEINRTTETKNILIEDKTNITFQQIISKSITIKKAKNIKLIVIDYLELINGYVKHQEQIARQLKILAQKLNVPIIAKIQLSNELVKRKNHIPTLEDIKNKTLVEMSDKILFLHRDDFCNNESEKKNIADIIIAKNDNDKTEVIEVLALDEYDKFENLIRKWE